MNLKNVQIFFADVGYFCKSATYYGNSTTEKSYAASDAAKVVPPCFRLAFGFTQHTEYRKLFARHGKQRSVWQFFLFRHVIYVCFRHVILITSCAFKLHITMRFVVYRCVFRLRAQGIRSNFKGKPGGTKGYKRGIEGVYTGSYKRWNAWRWVGPVWQNQKKGSTPPPFSLKTTLGHSRPSLVIGLPKGL